MAAETAWGNKKQRAIRQLINNAFYRQIHAEHLVETFFVENLSWPEQAFDPVDIGTFKAFCERQKPEKG